MTMASHRRPRPGQRFLKPLRDHLHRAGLDHISEVADGDRAAYAGGTPFQAWSLGELMRPRAFAQPRFSRHAANALDYRSFRQAFSQGRTNVRTLRATKSLDNIEGARLHSTGLFAPWHRLGGRILAGVQWCTGARGLQRERQPPGTISRTIMRAAGHTAGRRRYRRFRRRPPQLVRLARPCGTAATRSSKERLVRPDECAGQPRRRT